MKLIKIAKREKINPAQIKREYLEKIEAELENDCVVAYDIDNGLEIEEKYSYIPAALTDLSSRDLGNFLNAHVQQKMYYRTLLSRAKLRQTEAKRFFMEASGRRYAELSRGKLTETAKDRIIQEQDNVKPYYIEYEDWCNRCMMLESCIANMEDAIFLISREITRRVGDFNEEQRGYSVDNKRHRR